MHRLAVCITPAVTQQHEAGSGHAAEARRATVDYDCSLDNPPVNSYPGQPVEYASLKVEEANSVNL